MARLPLDRAIPNDELGFEILNNVLMFGNQSKATRGTLDVIDLGEEILYKGLAPGERMTRRRIEKFVAQPHMKILHDNKALIICQFAINDVGSLMRRYITSVKVLEVRWRHTDRGIVYMVYPDAYNMCLYASHFFDRFIQRGLCDDEISRVKAIGKYLWYTLNRQDNSIYVSPDTGYTVCFCKEGAALGDQRLLADKAHRIQVPVTFYKTFISRDMFSPRQQWLEQNAAQIFAPLDYEFLDRCPRAKKIAKVG